jgi:two-component system, NarL family, response regulator LiaR
MTRRGRIRVVVVDDHDMLRQGLATFLHVSRDLALVGEASNGEDAVRLCRELTPDVVLMDLLMPGMGGVRAIEFIHQAQPEIRIVALSSFGEDQLVKAAIKAGATSYLLKNISAANLAAAIRATWAGLPTLAPEVTPALVEEGASTTGLGRGSNLTRREREVLALMVEGLSNNEMSGRLYVSPYTVKNHVSSILGKLGVSSRTQAVSLALQCDIVRLD